MADNKFFNNQDVYVETDYDNIIIVDPNRVVDSDGTVSERLVNQEELVMYANLETKVLPRSKLVVGSNFQDTIENIRIGALDQDKSTVINFMKPQTTDNGQSQTQDDYLDTSWTDNLTLGQNRGGDADSQMLGITNISVKVNASFAAIVSIEMEDVQGRVLFEQGENSPYSAFFQFPYPLFTLTLKGYYGKAIRYELMLKDFNARFDPSSGNYKISTNFISRTYAMLSDIPIEALFALPHMYSRTTTIGTDKSSNQTGQDTQEIRQIKSTKGYDTIKEVYSAYKAKGLIEDNFPELTINQMLLKLQNFERYVMEAYGKEDMSPLTEIQKYLNTINEYRNEIYGLFTGNWFSENIDNRVGLITTMPNSPILYPIKNNGGKNEKLQKRKDAISELESIIEKYNTKLNENPVFGTNGSAEVSGKKIETTLNCDIKISDFKRQKPTESEVDYENTFELRYKSTPTELELSDFKNNVIIKELAVPPMVVDAQTLEVEEDSVLNQYIIFGDQNSSNNLTKKSFLRKLEELQDNFETKKQQVEEAISYALAEKIKSPDVGLGFNPTINNVMAVICASADGFLRLMDKVHDDAWDKRKDPIRVGAIMSPEKSEGTETTMVNALLNGLSSFGTAEEDSPTVYPWPQYFVTSIDEEGNELYEDKYPGDTSEVNKVQGWKYSVWPEIQFVEEFVKGAVQIENQTLGYNYTNELKETPFISCNAIEFPFQGQPYGDLRVVSFFYELFERTFLNSNYTKLYRDSGYNNELYSVFGDFEYINLQESVVKSPELIELLKNFSFSYENLLKYMLNISNNGQGQSWNLFRRGDFTTPYIKSLIKQDFGVYKLSYLEGNSIKVSSSSESSNKLIKYLNSNQSDELTFTDGYPFNNLDWLQNNLSEGNKVNSIRISNDTSKMFSFNEDQKTIASFSNEDETYGKKMFSYFEWITNTSTSPNQEVSEMSPNPNNNSENIFETNNQVINYYNYRTKEKFVLTESTLEYGNNYDTTKNFITKTQTTSLLNTPYFANAILKGVENEKNEIENPYAVLGYLYLNSLPLTTLKEKFKSYSNNVTTDLNYIFATLNKFSSIHKVPYYWILKYGSIWYRYKKYKESGIDILDDIWKDFDYKFAYDPIGGNTSKSYTFENYDGDSVTIKQLEEEFGTIVEDISPIPNEVLNVTYPYVNKKVENGFYPKVINSLYYYFTKKDIFTTYTSDEIQNAQTEKNLKIGNSDNGSIDKIISSGDTRGQYNMNSWSQYFNIKGNYDFRENQEDKILIVPSFGSVKFNQAQFECFNTQGKYKQNLTTNNSIYNGSVRSFWASSNFGYFSNEMVSKPTPLQYIKNINPENRNAQPFNISDTDTSPYSSIDDIFGVFTKEMLDNFESYFLNFCEVDTKYNIDKVNRGETTFEEFLELNFPELVGDDITVTDLNRKLELERVYNNVPSTFNGLNANEYDINLSTVMKSLFIIDKPTITNNIDEDLKNISDGQLTSFLNYHIQKALNREIVLKIGNPGKYDNKVYGSVTTVSNQMIKDPYDFGTYVANSLPTQGGSTSLGESEGNHAEAWNSMYLNVGEFNEVGFKYGDNGSYLTDFFVDMDYEFNESNVVNLSSLIKIYAAKKSQDSTYNKNKFIEDLNNSLIDKENFQQNILNDIFIKLNRQLPSVSVTDDTFRISKIDGNVPKLELWKSFQVLNDKWIAGQDFKTRTIFEDFLFLDRANRPIGDKVVINIKELEGFLRGRSDKTTVYSLLGTIYEKNNFVFMPTPAYTNFYGRDDRVKKGEPFPQDIPNDLFGTFMEVDARNSRPKMLGVWMGPPSENLGMEQNKNVRKGNDSFDITNPSDCPLRENQQNKDNYSDSNRCVGFQVDFGKRNQGVFNSVSIDMNQHKNIGPTFGVLEQLASQASGQKVAQQSQSLYNFYKSRSYTCQVQSLGNVMIQPTMYFNLTNVPMFYGPYYIMNVSHNISTRGFVTNFEGVRMPKYSFPTPDKLVASVNRELLGLYQQKLRSIEINNPSGKTNNIIALSEAKDISQVPEEKCKSLTKFNDKSFVDMTPTKVNGQEVKEYIDNNQFTNNNLKSFIYGIATQNQAVRQNVYNNNLMDLVTSREIRPTQRTQYFNSQTCISANEQVFPIASFSSIKDSLDFMKATFNPLGTILRAINEELQLTTTINTTPKALTYLYLAQVYEINPIQGTPQQIISIVKTKINNNTEYKSEYEEWLNIFTSVVSRGDI